MSTSSTVFAEKLSSLRATYASQLPDRIRELEQAVKSSDRAGTDRLLHNLIGASGTMGFSGVCSAASALNALLKSSGPIDETFRSQAAGFITRMKKSALPRSHGGFQDLPTEAAASAGPNRLLYILEDDPLQAETLAMQLGQYGYMSRTFATLEGLETGLSQALPAAVIVDIILPEGPLAGARGIAALRSLRKLPIPVLFLTVRGDLEARIEAVRAGADAYFTKPGDVGQLLDRLEALTSGGAPDPYRVLIVDDDKLVSEYSASVLRQSGMIVSVVNEPFKIEQPLQELRPDLILMDLNMPECSGQELGAAIRQQPEFVGTPIVFLSSETQFDKQVAARSVGGDDFLTKPIPHGKLVAEVSLRVERARAVRHHLVRDAHTGLLNHTSFMSQLQAELARAQRRNSCLAFAMIDVDKFKGVNDRHGHLAGDRVLRSLARLLQQRLRKTDLIGRYRGDEFAVALVDTDPEGALRVLDEVRGAFAKLQHGSGERIFSVTMSCGVAVFPAFPDAKLLKEAADQAMYRGKIQGGNHVTLIEE